MYEQQHLQQPPILEYFYAFDTTPCKNVKHVSHHQSGEVSCLLVFFFLKQHELLDNLRNTLKENIWLGRQNCTAINLDEKLDSTEFYDAVRQLISAIQSTLFACR